MGMGDDSTSGQSADTNNADLAFTMMMIPHHEGAIEMSDVLLSKSGVEPEVAELAEQIKGAQGPEIEQMTTWLDDWDQAVPDPDAMMDDNMDHSGGMMMSGMMSEADMASLGNATGTDFDRMFLEMMILHHEGAIEMAEEELAEEILKHQVAPEVIVRVEDAMDMVTDQKRNDGSVK